MVDPDNLRRRPTHDRLVVVDMDFEPELSAFYMYHENQFWTPGYADRLKLAEVRGKRFCLPVYEDEHRYECFAKVEQFCGDDVTRPALKLLDRVFKAKLKELKDQV